MHTNDTWLVDDLKPGLMVCDIASGDVGILTRRYDVMANWSNESPIWAWDMMWAGPATDEINRNTPFTEFGVLGLLNSGRWDVVEG